MTDHIFFIYILTRTTIKHVYTAPSPIMNPKVSGRYSICAIPG